MCVLPGGKLLAACPSVRSAVAPRTPAELLCRASHRARHTACERMCAAVRAHVHVHHVLDSLHACRVSCVLYSSTIAEGGLPSKAISWMRVNSGNSAERPLALSTTSTSFEVMVPCSFWPLSIDFSSSSQSPSPLANASAHLRLRPPKHVVTRSARPHDSRNVSSWMPPKNILANLMVSLRPMRMMAALVLPPMPRPSQKPAPSATTFLSAPHSSTPATSLIEPTRKVGQSRSRCQHKPLA